MEASCLPAMVRKCCRRRRRVVHVVDQSWRGMRIYLDPGLSALERVASTQLIGNASNFQLCNRACVQVTFE